MAFILHWSRWVVRWGMHSFLAIQLHVIHRLILVQSKMKLALSACHAKMCQNSNLAVKNDRLTGCYNHIYFTSKFLPKSYLLICVMVYLLLDICYSALVGDVLYVMWNPRDACVAHHLPLSKSKQCTLRALKAVGPLILLSQFQIRCNPIIPISTGVYSHNLNFLAQRS